MRLPRLRPSSLKNTLETERLYLRQATADDDAFILKLLNEPSWLRFIGDRHIRTQADARRYISEILVPTYTRFGFGLYLVETKETAEPIGLCGLIKRDSLADVDIGFALLRRHWHRGYAFESACAVIQHARKTFALRRIVAITDPRNDASIKLLERLGFVYDRMVSFEKITLKLYAKAL